jgi:hypothetical protein
MENKNEFNLNGAVENWRNRLSQSPQFRAENLNELEGHLRDSVTALQTKGLSDEEAFLIASRRLGSSTALGCEFAKVNAREVWLGRLLWMVIGIQAWAVFGHLSGVFSRWIVLGGLMSLGYEFKGDPHSIFGVSLLPAILILAAYGLVLLGGIWICRWLVSRPEGTLSRAVSYVAARPRRLVLAVVVGVVLSLATVGLGYVESIYLIRNFAMEKAGALLMSRSVAMGLGAILKVIGLLILTAVLLRRRLVRQAGSI